ncbi:MAG TPA: hypothetical protein VHM90_15010 [Phycisphaerae bacterium]|nr:hypothetical protein [Phycisphaerae bacterium]
MPAPGTISGRKFIAMLVMSVIAFVAAMWFAMPRQTENTNLQVVLHPSSFLPEISAIYYWPSYPAPEKLSMADVRRTASQANRAGNDYFCYYPIRRQVSWNPFGKTDCGKIPQELTLWLQTTDGTWTTQTVPFPKMPSENGNWEISLPHL